MKILSVDQSYTCTGLAVIEDGKPIYWQAVFPKGKTKAAKRARLMAELNNVFSCSIDLVVIESQWGKSGDSITTAIIDYAFSLNLEIKALNPRQWKNKMLGSANAPKSAAIMLAEELTNARFTNDNIADSICIGVCAHRYPDLLRKPE